jgi:hypothetical protein
LPEAASNQALRGERREGEREGERKRVRERRGREGENVQKNAHVVDALVQVDGVVTSDNVGRGIALLALLLLNLRPAEKHEKRTGATCR